MAQLISEMPGSAKSSLASHLNVSLREVERWSETAAQFRNYVPSRFWDQPTEDLPAEIRYRVFVADALENGFTAHVFGGGQQGSYAAGTGSLQTALQLAERYRFSQTGDEFRDNATTGIFISQVGSRWRVDIDYTVNYDAESGDWGEREWDDDWDELGEDFF